MDDVPLVGGQGLVHIHVGEQAEREDENSEINPGEEQHEDGEACDYLVLFNMCLEVEATAGHEDITGIMNDEDHDSGRYFVAHHRKQDQTRCHEVVEHPLVVLFLILSYHNKLEDGKNMHSQLVAKIDFQSCSMIRRPVRVFPIDLGT